MIYNNKNIHIPANNELSIIGASVNNTTRYVSPNLAGVYVNSDQQIYVSEANTECYKYAVNVLPYRASTNVQLYASIYKGTVIESPQIIAYANNLLFRSLFGIYLEEDTRCAVVDIGGKTITTNTKVKDYCTFNYNMMYIFNNKLVSKGTEFVYLQNCILQQYVNIKYSNIFHPLQLTNFRPLYNFMEAGNNSVKFNILSNTTNLSAINSITLSRLKMLFSVDGNTWYKYNTGAEIFQPLVPSGSYFTFAELCAQGNDYQTYINIPLSKYTDVFGEHNVEKILVMSNGWILPRYIKHSFYNDKIDQGQFLWNNSTTIAKRTVYIGDV